MFCKNDCRFLNKDVSYTANNIWTCLFYEKRLENSWCGNLDDCYALRCEDCCNECEKFLNENKEEK